MLKGFRFSVVSAGIKYKDRNDMGLILSDMPAVAAGVFTKNKIKAAPVKLSKRHLIGGSARAIIVNSGNANACTGRRGMLDALATSKLVADMLNVPEREVLVASTGVIGVPLPMEKLKKTIPVLIKNIGNANLLDVAKAIMTTDTFPKVSQDTINIGRKRCQITGIAKGAGMIAPDMATMLAFILTDALLEPSFAKSVLKECVDETFNSISVDGDTSTNDTVFMLSNGASSAQPIGTGSTASKRFRTSLFKVCDDLATMIVRDGEGASKRLVIKVKGAKTHKEAQMVSKTVANSMLVKTGFSGTEPNWGRVVAAVGRAGVPIREDRIRLIINGVTIFSKGTPSGREDVLRDRLSGDTVEISIDLNRGTVNSTFQTSDLTEEYVRINTDYLT